MMMWQHGVQAPRTKRKYLEAVERKQLLLLNSLFVLKEMSDELF